MIFHEITDNDNYAIKLNQPKSISAEMFFFVCFFRGEKIHENHY